MPDFESAGEAATRRWGLPNSYILGQESAGDFRDYHWEGDGIMFNPDYSDSRLYWRSSTNKFGARAESQRTMILIYGRLNSGNAAFSFDDDLFEPPALIGGILVAASRARQTLIVTLRPILANLAAPRRGHISFTTHSTQIGTDYNGVQLTA